MENDWQEKNVGMKNNFWMKILFIVKEILIA